MADMTLTQAFCKLWEVAHAMLDIFRKESPDPKPLSIATEQIVGANSYWESPTIDNEMYSSARVFFDAVFSNAHTGGLVVDLYFKNVKLGMIMKVPSQSVSSGCVSTSFDIKQLSGWRIVVKNQDIAHNTTIKNLRVVMW